MFDNGLHLMFLHLLVYQESWIEFISSSGPWVSWLSPHISRVSATSPRKKAEPVEPFFRHLAFGRLTALGSEFCCFGYVSASAMAENRYIFAGCRWNAVNIAAECHSVRPALSVCLSVCLSAQNFAHLYRPNPLQLGAENFTPYAGVREDAV